MTMDDLLFLLIAAESTGLRRTRCRIPTVRPGACRWSARSRSGFWRAGYFHPRGTRFRRSRIPDHGFRRGKIKRTILKEYSQVRSNGLIAIGLEEGDLLGWVSTAWSPGSAHHHPRGQTIRFRRDEGSPHGPAGQWRDRH
ncbi:MAG: hypothetical protein U0Z44_09100 [Kouleothrix sp.]